MEPLFKHSDLSEVKEFVRKVNRFDGWVYNPKMIYVDMFDLYQKYGRETPGNITTQESIAIMWEFLKFIVSDEVNSTTLDDSTKCIICGEPRYSADKARSSYCYDCLYKSRSHSGDELSPKLKSPRFLLSLARVFEFQGTSCDRPIGRPVKPTCSKCGVREKAVFKSGKREGKYSTFCKPCQAQVKREYLALNKLKGKKEPKKEEYKDPTKCNRCKVNDRKVYNDGKTQSVWCGPCISEVNHNRYVMTRQVSKKPKEPKTICSKCKIGLRHKYKNTTSSWCKDCLDEYARQRKELFS